MPSSVVALLAERPEAELREMQSKLSAKQAHLETDLARVQFESEQIIEALARQTRSSGSRAGQRRRPAPPGATQKRILDAVASADGPISPAQIIAAMEATGVPAPSRGSIHNTISRLFKNGLLTKPGDGQYELASRNGSTSNPFLEGLENEVSEPLSTVTQPQEGT